MTFGLGLLLALNTDDRLAMLSNSDVERPLF
jgi:hypothetical protein